MKISGTLKIALTIFIGLAIVTAGRLPALANNYGMQTDQPEGIHQAKVDLPTAKVTISKKKHQWVITNIGDRYLVKHGTIITDADGHQVGLRELRIPCLAEIVYQNDQGVRKAHRIRIVSISTNANSYSASDMFE